jgi:DnaJ-class molecular chaperone
VFDGHDCQDYRINKLEDEVWDEKIAYLSSRQFTIYELLHLPVDVPREEIVKEYRKRALEYHPDKSMNLSGKKKEYLDHLFKLITNAYNHYKEELHFDI